jgi:hypothetical protein
MSKKKLFWLLLVTNFDTFVVEVIEGKKKARIYDSDNPDIKFKVEILGDSFACESTFGVVNTSKKLVSIADMESHLKAMEERDDHAVVIQLHEAGDKVLILSTKTKTRKND